MILIVDDDASICMSLRLLLKQEGFASQSAEDPEQALALLARESFDLVLQDMNFTRGTSGEEGLALLAAVKARHPGLPVILMTAWGSIALAVAGMRAGAADFITKPWSHEQLMTIIRNVLDLQRARGGTSSRNRDELDAHYDFGDLLGPATYGHWGATGTLMWIDPERDTVCVILTTEPQEPHGREIARLSNAIAASLV